MAFFIAMFVCSLMVPLVMLIAGVLMYKRPPKEINDVFGYRTSMSKKNMDTWTFAHRTCGKLWMILGGLLLVCVVLSQLPFAHADEDTVGLVTIIIEAVEVAVILLSIIPVEKALKRTFDENGERK